MNKYLYPVCTDKGDAYIDTVMAKDANDAKDRIVRRFLDEYDWDCSDDWDSLVDCAWEHYVSIGEPEDIINFT